MAHSYHHAVSSARKFGGVPEDYTAVHSWFDRSKEIVADFRKGQGAAQDSAHS